jgi:putative heme-binding domain-containing protein
MRLLFLVTGLGLASATLHAQAAPTDDLAAGRVLFESQCSRCHGVNGTGGVGPALNRPVLRRASTDDAIVQVILGGIPGTAMVSFWNLSEGDARQVTAYIRSLGRRPPEILAGDPVRGQRLYQTTGQCGSCHILGGQGAGWAPDLTDAGLRLSAEQIRQALLDPGAAQPISPLPSMHGPYPAFLAVEATTAAGRVVRGTRVTEDDFTIVVRDGAGKLHSLEKQGLKRLVKTTNLSPMPSYRSILSPTELDDVIAYIANQRGVS